MRIVLNKHIVIGLTDTLNFLIAKNILRNQYIISEPRLIAWMTEASLLARPNRSADIKDLLDSPSILPFRLAHGPAEYVASFSPRLETLRHGLFDNLVTIQK